MANKKKNEVEKRMTRRTTKIAIIGIALIVGSTGCKHVSAPETQNAMNMASVTFTTNTQEAENNVETGVKTQIEPTEPIESTTQIIEVVELNNNSYSPPPTEEYEYIEKTQYYSAENTWNYDVYGGYEETEYSYTPYQYDAYAENGAEMYYNDANYSYNDYGTCLTAENGVFQGPSGLESYYNLDMSGCISNMQSIGIYDTYWLRSDGVKMYGSYIMVAACFDIRPLGSLVETSLGTGIVCDTGEFVYANPYQIDIATNW